MCCFVSSFLLCRWSVCLSRGSRCGYLSSPSRRWRSICLSWRQELGMISPIAPPEEHVSLRGPRGEYPSSPSRRRRSMCRSGGQEVSIFFPVTPPEEHMSHRGSRGGYLSPPSRRRRSMCHSGGLGGKYLAFPGSPGWCRGKGLTLFVSMGYQVFYFS